jgi:hypothetical protein
MGVWEGARVVLSESLKGWYWVLVVIGCFWLADLNFDHY